MPLPSTMVIITCSYGPYGELNFVDLESDMCLGASTLLDAKTTRNIGALPHHT